jgi:hypothetical protein
MFHAQSFSRKRACRAKAQKGWRANFDNKKPGRIAGLMLMIADPLFRHAGLDPTSSRGASVPLRKSLAIKDLSALNPGSSPG